MMFVTTTPGPGAEVKMEFQFCVRFSSSALAASAPVPLAPWQFAPDIYTICFRKHVLIFRSFGDLKSVTSLKGNSIPHTKIIPEEKSNRDNGFPADRSLINKKNALDVNSNFEALVVKKINSDRNDIISGVDHIILSISEFWLILR